MADGLFELTKIPQLLAVKDALPIALNAPDPELLRVNRQGLPPTRNPPQKVCG